MELKQELRDFGFKVRREYFQDEKGLRQGLCKTFHIEDGHILIEEHYVNNKKMGRYKHYAYCNHAIYYDGFIGELTLEGETIYYQTIDQAL